MQIRAHFGEMILHDNRRELERTFRVAQVRRERRRAGGASTELARLRLHWELSDDGSGSRLIPTWLRTRLD
jgi:hypothetical protein